MGAPPEPPRAPKLRLGSPPGLLRGRGLRTAAGWTGARRRRRMGRKERGSRLDFSLFLGGDVGVWSCGLGFFSCWGVLYPTPGWVYPVDVGCWGWHPGVGGPVGAGDVEQGWAPACCPQEGPHSSSPPALGLGRDTSGAGVGGDKCTGQPGEEGKKGGEEGK